MSELGSLNNVPLGVDVVRSAPRVRREKTDGSRVTPVEREAAISLFAAGKSKEDVSIALNLKERTALNIKIEEEAVIADRRLRWLAGLAERLESTIDLALSSMTPEKIGQASAY